MYAWLHLDGIHSVWYARILGPKIFFLIVCGPTRPILLFSISWCFLLFFYDQELVDFEHEDLRQAVSTFLLSLVNHLLAMRAEGIAFNARKQGRLVWDSQIQEITQ